MAKPRLTARGANQKSISISKKRQARKNQMLKRGVASITRSIADAICIKNGNIFFVSGPDGNLPLEDGHGYGLYYHDCRYLSGYELELADARPIVLAAVTGELGCATFELTNPHIECKDGRELPSGEIGIAWSRELDPTNLCLNDHILFKNYSQHPSKFDVTIRLAADFEDVFAVRGLFSERPGKLHAPAWRSEELVFVYEGVDDYQRSLAVSFLPKPDTRRGDLIRYAVALNPLESREIRVTAKVIETRQKAHAASDRISAVGREFADPKLDGQQQPDDWCKSWPEIQSDSPVLNEVITRANHDLQSLRSSIRGDNFFAAGIPWFTTLFGRDSLITALQLLPVEPQIAAQTLRLLATYQAHETDAWRDAQPGKILHELRVGELATIGSTPHSPYYGTVDATPLFLILMGRYIEWTGDLGLFEELREPLERAVQWIDQFGDSDGDGYIDYKTTSDQGLPNQGWKDSLDSIQNSDGTYAEPPIALVEVQGYVYRAKLALADLYERSSESDHAADLREAARALQTRFNRDYWSEHLGTYILARQKGGRPAAVVASNAGQALWSGIADADHAAGTVRRLMADDMFSGWGIRTLSQNERGFNPIGYHVGSVWPHDSAMIAEGFHRYGYYEEALRVFMGLLEAAMNFQEYQLPELFSGFSRDQYAVPVHYPAACHPQSWAAGSIPYLLFGLLGLRPNALERSLDIHHALLPAGVGSIDITGLRVGDASLNLRYERGADGATIVKALQSDPQLQVHIL